MISKDFEQRMILEVPLISPKIPNSRLEEFSRQRWLSDDAKAVAKDIVQNAKELLIGGNTDWELVLGSIRAQKLNIVQFGEAAIAADSARTIGALAVYAGWSMHDPPIVYLSGRLIADRVKNGENLGDFKNRMLEAAINYGNKVLPHADFYIEILDFLLQPKDRGKYGFIIRKVAPLLREGNIEGAYNMINPRDDLVRKKG